MQLFLKREVFNLARYFFYLVFSPFIQIFSLFVYTIRLGLNLPLGLMSC